MSVLDSFTCYSILQIVKPFDYPQLFVTRLWFDGYVYIRGRNNMEMPCWYKMSAHGSPLLYIRIGILSPATRLAGRDFVIGRCVIVLRCVALCGISICTSFCLIVVRRLTLRWRYVAILVISRCCARLWLFLGRSFGMFPVVV